MYFVKQNVIKSRCIKSYATLNIQHDQKSRPSEASSLAIILFTIQKKNSPLTTQCRSLVARLPTAIPRGVWTPLESKWKFMYHARRHAIRSFHDLRHMQGLDYIYVRTYSCFCLLLETNTCAKLREVVQRCEVFRELRTPSAGWIPLFDVINLCECSVALCLKCETPRVRAGSTQRWIKMHKCYSAKHEPHPYTPRKIKHNVCVSEFVSR